MKIREQANMFTRKKGAIDLKQVPATIIVIGLSVMFAVVVTIVLVALGGQTTDANATAQINAGKETLTKILTFFVIIGTVVGAVIMIRLLTKAF